MNINAAYIAVNPLEGNTMSEEREEAFANLLDKAKFMVKEHDKPDPRPRRAIQKLEQAIRKAEQASSAG